VDFEAIAGKHAKELCGFQPVQDAALADRNRNFVILTEARLMSHAPRTKAGQMTATCGDQHQLKLTHAKKGAVHR